MLTMKKPNLFLAGALSAVGLPAFAQPVQVSANTLTKTSLYAQELIELLPGFRTTTGGFEARIQLLPARTKPDFITDVTHRVDWLLEKGLF